MPLNDAAKFFSEFLDKVKIPYTVIGGVAVGMHGDLRATRDIDIIVLLESEDVDDFLDEIEAAGLQISRKASVAAKLKGGRPAKILWDDIFSVDLRRAHYAIDLSALDNAVGEKTLGTVLSITPPEELVAYKLARFADIDKHDIKTLIRYQTLDWKKISALTQELSDEAKLPIMMEHLKTALTWRRR